MEKLLFIASIQYGEPPTGGGAQAKNQLLLAHLQKYYDVRFFDTWNKCSAVSLLSAIFYIIVFNRKCVLSISGRGALSIGKLLSFLHIRRLIIYFVIGGSLGLSDNVLKRADMKLSFSRMTFPHQLMRVILLEQIYRGFRIMNNEPYHK